MNNVVPRVTTAYALTPWQSDCSSAACHTAWPGSLGGCEMFFMIGGLVWALLILIACRWFYVISERREDDSSKSNREV